MYLPRPPAGPEPELYVKQDRWLIYGVGFISSALLLLGGCLFVGTHPVLLIWAPIVLVQTIYLMITYIIGLSGRPFSNELYVESTRGKIISWPDVDVLLPIAGEDLELLKNTWRHVRKMRDTYFGRMRVIVLDDGKDDLAKEACYAAGFEYMRRPNAGYMKKAGNLRFGFTQTESPYFMILDADFCPSVQMCNLMVRQMLKEPKAGVIQSPQWFRVEGSLIQRGSAQIQELFYRLLQVNRNTFGASACVGTNALYRRKALEPNGGTYEIGYSEDLHTGFWLLSRGWKVIYTPIIHACGICPETAAQFFSQQYRWCMGSMTLLTNPFFWNTKLSWHQRLSYLSGFLYYIATAVGVVSTMLPSVIVLWFFPTQLLWFNYVFSFPSFIFSTLVMHLWTRAGYGVAAHVCREISYWAHLRALVDKARGSLMPWQATNVVKGSVAFSQTRRLVLLHTVIVFTLLISGMMRFGGDAYHLIPLVVFTSFALVIRGVTIREMYK